MNHLLGPHSLDPGYRDSRDPAPSTVEPYREFVPSARGIEMAIPALDFGCHLSNSEK